MVISLGRTNLGAMHSMLVTLALAVAAARSSGGGGAVTICAESKNSTGCPSAGATCCPHSFSSTKWGCCPMPNAVCCAGSYGLCCPADHTCEKTGAYSGLCKPKSVDVAAARDAQLLHEAPPPPNLFTGGAPQVCTPGAIQPPSQTLPSAIVIGDSVSIGYTPHVAAKLAGKVQVQHSPSAGGGGADDTPYGAQCILGESAGHTESFLRTARYEPVKWGVILFNFGLHDMETNATGGAHSLANYSAQLTAIAEKLQGTGSKLLYVATTPFMPYTSLGDPIVPKLNAAAKLIMDAKRIPIIDLWGHVVAKCGPGSNR